MNKMDFADYKAYLNEAEQFARAEQTDPSTNDSTEDLAREAEIVQLSIFKNFGIKDCLDERIARLSGWNEGEGGFFPVGDGDWTDQHGNIWRRPKSTY